jgi:hypothetical protein
MGARGSVVGWGTMLPGSSLDAVEFCLIYQIQPHYGPVVDSASNRNEYQESSWGGKRTADRRIKLITLPPSVSRLSRENVGASTAHKPMGLHGLLQG